MIGCVSGLYNDLLWPADVSTQCCYPPGNSEWASRKSPCSNEKRPRPWTTIVREERKGVALEPAATSGDGSSKYLKTGRRIHHAPSQWTILCAPHRVSNPSSTLARRSLWESSDMKIVDGNF
ncbi:unnamed protein product [Angiostrongylus costaricensis]|uniref:Uncharacterized protein n=1 Tax=Angiostrongylus costaricensis TaxID=334426 RepID=A0A0R3PD25_ANGCS|nr:unnamed protein product [Angiostrongylus costaricensis]